MSTRIKEETLSYDGSSVSGRMISMIRLVPSGKVASYAQIARVTGLPHGARQVARILHSCTAKHDLPWHRIVRSSGGIALPPDRGGAEQRALLINEGVRFISVWMVDIAGCGVSDQFFLVTSEDSFTS